MPSTLLLNDGAKAGGFILFVIEDFETYMYALDINIALTVNHQKSDLDCVSASRILAIMRCINFLLMALLP